MTTKTQTTREKIEEIVKSVHKNGIDMVVADQFGGSAPKDNVKQAVDQLEALVVSENNKAYSEGYEQQLQMRLRDEKERTFPVKKGS